MYCIGSINHRILVGGSALHHCTIHPIPKVETISSAHSRAENNPSLIAKHGMNMMDKVTSEQKKKRNSLSLFSIHIQNAQNIATRIQHELMSPRTPPAQRTCRRNCVNFNSTRNAKKTMVFVAKKDTIRGQ